VSYHDWGSNIDGYLQWRREHPFTEEQNQMGRDYKQAPDRFSATGLDPGLFGSDPYFEITEEEKKKTR
jgi:hypothetical protein